MSARRRLPRLLVVPASLLLLAGDTPPAGHTEILSTSEAGVLGDGDALTPAISANGRFVAFRSDATQLVADDENGKGDVFVRDRKKGTVVRASLAADGSEGNDTSGLPNLSSNGRWLAFSADATNLVVNDGNAAVDVFVRDLKKGTLTRESVDSTGDEGDAGATLPFISKSGRFVAFISSSANLVEGDENGEIDVFVRDRKAGVTERVSVSSEGEEGDGTSSQPVISASCRFVAFLSNATNLVPNDGNGSFDCFVRDRKTGTTTRVSVSSTGEQGDGSCNAGIGISANGRFVCFSSAATNMVGGDSNGNYDTFVHDRKTGVTTRASVGLNGEEAGDDCQICSISGNGRHVSFQSSTSALVAGDRNDKIDVFVKDAKTGVLALASVSTGLEQGDADSSCTFAIPLSSNGRLVVFESGATNLVDGDDNAKLDIFLRDLKK